MNVCSFFALSRVLSNLANTIYLRVYSVAKSSVYAKSRHRHPLGIYLQTCLHHSLPLHLKRGSHEECNSVKTRRINLCCTAYGKTGGTGRVLRLKESESAIIIFLPVCHWVLDNSGIRCSFRTLVLQNVAHNITNKSTSNLCFLIRNPMHSC